MKFEWNEDKNQSNIAKHGISFADAKTIFDGFTVDALDNRQDYGEARTISVGTMQGVVVIVVVHTDRDGATRLISARQAKRKEREDYDEALRRSLESGGASGSA